MKKIVIALILIIATSTTCFASTEKLFKLENGQTVIIQEVKNNPIVTIDTWVKTGSIDETDENNGVAHFLEHLFFKGTKTHAPGEFDKILETKGAINNAATSKDFTHYYITIPSKDFNLAMDLHADMLLHPMIPRKEMEKERKVVLEEICKDISSPTRILQENLNTMMYSLHPYKRRVIGKSEIIETITRDGVLDFYNQHYFPSNMVTVVIGDVDTNQALNKIKESFNSSYKKFERPIYKKETPLTSQKRKTEYVDTESGYMLIGFRAASINQKDSYALDVLATILGDGRSSILNNVLKENKRIVTSIDAGNSTYKDDGIFYVSATFEPDKTEQVEGTIFSEIEKIQKQGVTDEQLKLAKNIIERSTYYSRESITNIATEIGYTVTLTDDIKFYNTYLDKIKEVSKEEVKRVANKYLGINKSAISIVLPKTPNEKPVALKTSKKNNETAKLISQNSQSKKYQLSNGVTLISTPNISNDIIAISIYAKGGLLNEKKSGVGTLTASLLTRGTKNYSSIEFSQYLDDNGIKISPSINGDAFSISVLTTKDEYEKTLKILNEMINNPTFEESELEKLKTERLNVIKANKDIALKRAVENYKSLIYKDSPYLSSAKTLEKTIPTISKKDIEEFYNNVFIPNNIVISINGNIDEQKTISVLNSLFNSENSVNSFNYNIHKNRIKNITTKQIITEHMPTTQTAWILLGWQTDGILNEKDFATLQVIDSILGTGMSSRLFINLREQEGLAYQLGSSFSPNVLKGNFMLYIGTNPKTLEQAKQGLFDEINKIKTQYVPDKELKEAKEKLIGNYVIGLETNLDKASNLGWYETSTRGYEFKDKYEKLINSVTDADIIDVANKYFNDNFVLSIVTQ